MPRRRGDTARAPVEVGLRSCNRDPSDSPGDARARTRAAREEHRVGLRLARAMLARRTGCDPARIRTGRSPHGRPLVIAPANARDLRVSVAHADGLVLCAIAEGIPIGADLESLRRVGPDPLGIAEVACTEQERRELRRTPADLRAIRLLELWTVKEALAKAVGLGVGLEFSKLEVARTSANAARVRWRLDSRDERTLWRVLTWRPSERHVAAIAIHVAGGLRCDGEEAA